MPVFKNESKQHLVCDGAVCELERRAQAEVQARLYHQARSAGVGADVSVADRCRP